MYFDIKLPVTDMHLNFKHLIYIYILDRFFSLYRNASVEVLQTHYVIH